jgi:hypothetical protein
MPHEDYELAERHWQDLREGRSKRLTADDVQQIANRMGRATDTVQRASRGQIDKRGKMRISPHAPWQVRRKLTQTLTSTGLGKAQLCSPRNGSRRLSKVIQPPLFPARG